METRDRSAAAKLGWRTRRYRILEKEAYRRIRAREPLTPEMEEIAQGLGFWLGYRMQDGLFSSMIRANVQDSPDLLRELFSR